MGQCRHDTLKCPVCASQSQIGTFQACSEEVSLISRSRNHRVLKVGMTKDSNRLLLESGFNLPWKEPTEPSEKKALLALEMDSSTEVSGDKLCCHHTTRMRIHTNGQRSMATFLDYVTGIGN